MYKIGSKQVSIAQIFAAPQPTQREMATFCDFLGRLIQNRIPILEVFIVVAESTSHPWLLAILAKTSEGLREGRTIRKSVVGTLKDWVAHRVKEFGKMDSASVKFDVVNRHQWVLPDFFGFFAEFIMMVDVGEETGALDQAVFFVRDIHLNNGVVGTYQNEWGRDVSLFYAAFELLDEAGVGPIKALKVIRRSSMLREEIDIAIEELLNGKSLDRSLQKANGQLAHPVLRSLVYAGEHSSVKPVNR